MLFKIKNQKVGMQKKTTKTFKLTNIREIQLCFVTLHFFFL
jgi:hypothetical protein